MKLFSWGITTREIAIKQKTQHDSINFALKGLSFYDQGLHLENSYGHKSDSRLSFLVLSLI